MFFKKQPLAVRHVPASLETALLKITRMQPSWKVEKRTGQFSGMEDDPRRCAISVGYDSPEGVSVEFVRHYPDPERFPYWRLKITNVVEKVPIYEIITSLDKPKWSDKPRPRSITEEEKLVSVWGKAAYERIESFLSPAVNHFFASIIAKRMAEQNAKSVADQQRRTKLKQEQVERDRHAEEVKKRFWST